jgi:hypothetical protein
VGLDPLCAGYQGMSGKPSWLDPGCAGSGVRGLRENLRNSGPADAGLVSCPHNQINSGLSGSGASAEVRRALNQDLFGPLGQLEAPMAQTILASRAQLVPATRVTRASLVGAHSLARRTSLSSAAEVVGSFHAESLLTVGVDPRSS